MTDMKSTGTPFDDVFKTLLEKCRQLIIPVINEVFKTDYDIKEEVKLLSSEFHYISGQGQSNKKVTDSCIQIRNKMYHIECQSNSDSLMEIRMIEYDFFIALSDMEQYEDGHIIKFPESAVLYLRHNGRTPDNFKIRLLIPGGEKVEYSVPVVKVQDYDRQEIFNKNLLFFIPYYILRFEDRMEDIDNNMTELCAFKTEYQEIYNKLKELNKKDIIDINYLNNLILLTEHLAFIVADKAENVKKEVEVMRGKVLRFETDDIWEEAHQKGFEEGLKKGCEKGIEEGIEVGLEEGESLKVISQIKKKVSKNKTADVIADELEEDILFIEKVINVINKYGLISDKEIYNHIR